MKALILYTNTGGGHNSAAKAAAEAFEYLGMDVKLMDSLKIAGEKVSDRVSKIYNAAVRKSPRIFGMFYNAGKKVSKPHKRSVVYRLNSLYAAKLNGILMDEKPDIILCTHLFAGQTITHVKRKFGLTALTAAVITDYTYSPMWEETRLDFYFIPHEDLRQQFIEKQIPAEKLFSTGIPVSSEFMKHVEKRKAKLEHGYNPAGFHVLITGGSMGAGNIFETTLGLSREQGDMDITVVCGSNQGLYRRLQSINSNGNLRIIQFTEQMAELMACADVIVTKPGGLTSTEAMIKGMPFIIISPIPGGETDNCAFFTRHGMAVEAGTAKEAVQLCKFFRYNEAEAVKMIEAQRKNIYCSSGLDIARFLIDKIREQERVKCI